MCAGKNFNTSVFKRRLLYFSLPLYVDAYVECVNLVTYVAHVQSFDYYK